MTRAPARLLISKTTGSNLDWVPAEVVDRNGGGAGDNLNAIPRLEIESHSPDRIGDLNLAIGSSRKLSLGTTVVTTIRPSGRPFVQVANGQCLVHLLLVGADERHRINSDGIN